MPALQTTRELGKVRFVALVFLIPISCQALSHQAACEAERAGSSPRVGTADCMLFCRKVAFFLLSQSGGDKLFSGLILPGSDGPYEFPVCTRARIPQLSEARYC